MQLSLKDCWNTCVSIGTISELVCFKMAAFKLSGPSDLCGLQLVSRFVTPWRVIFISGIDGYGDVPVSGYCLNL